MKLASYSNREGIALRAQRSALKFLRRSRNVLQLACVQLPCVGDSSHRIACGSRYTFPFTVAGKHYTWPILILFRSFTNGARFLSPWPRPQHMFIPRAIIFRVTPCTCPSTFLFRLSLVIPRCVISGTIAAEKRLEYLFIASFLPVYPIRT
jgi:hypothetical protein